MSRRFEFELGGRECHFEVRRLPDCEVCGGGIVRVEDERHGWLCLRHFLAISEVEYHGGDVDFTRTSAGDGRER